MGGTEFSGGNGFGSIPIGMFTGKSFSIQFVGHFEFDVYGYRNLGMGMDIKWKEKIALAMFFNGGVDILGNDRFHTLGVLGGKGRGGGGCLEQIENALVDSHTVFGGH